MITERDQELAKTLVGGEFAIDSSFGEYSGYYLDTFKPNSGIGHYTTPRAAFEWLRDHYDEVKDAHLLYLHVSYGLNLNNPMLQDLWNTLIDDHLAS